MAGKAKDFAIRKNTWASDTLCRSVVGVPSTTSACECSWTTPTVMRGFCPAWVLSGALTSTPRASKSLVYNRLWKGHIELLI